MFTKSSLRLLNLEVVVLLLGLLVLLEPSLSFVWKMGPSSAVHQQKMQSSSSSSSPSRRFVYTPEQQQDQDDKENSNNVGDQVLESLVKKLDKSSTSSTNKKKKDNKAMAFLKKIGKVGGAANKDFGSATGSDEGAGMSPMSSSPSSSSVSSSSSSSSSVRKSKQSFVEATESGIIDDMTENFPMTSSGTEWRGVSDRIRGGTSEGIIKRDVIDDGDDEKTVNVLIGKVTGDEGSFIQMVTELSKDYSTKDSVDASNYDGIEIDVLSKEGLEFNIHLRDPSLQKSSYRHTVELECLFAWQTIRVPFSFFTNDEKMTVNYSKLKRIGIAVLEKETDVYLAIGGLRFYNVI